MTLVAVADTGPLIHLAEIDALELLTHVDRLYVPAVVLRELEAGGVPDALAAIEFEKITAPDDRSGEFDLDLGERAALSEAADRNAVLLTDDLAARRAAKERNVEVHGSIGIIALGYTRGSLDRDDAVDSMRALQRQTSLFVTDAVVERGIAMLDGE